MAHKMVCFSFYSLFFTFFFDFPCMITQIRRTCACMNIYLPCFDVQIFRFTWCGKTNLHCSENKEPCISQHLGQTSRGAVPSNAIHKLVLDAQICIHIEIEICMHRQSIWFGLLSNYFLKLFTFYSPKRQNNNQQSSFYALFSWQKVE